MPYTNEMQISSPFGEPIYPRLNGAGTNSNAISGKFAGIWQMTYVVRFYVKVNVGWFTREHH